MAVNVHPLTIADIHRQGEQLPMSGYLAAAPCGCYVPCECCEPPSEARWPYDLCSYHDGYNDGIEALLAEMRKAVGS